MDRFTIKKNKTFLQVRDLMRSKPRMFLRLFGTAITILVLAILTIRNGQTHIIEVSRETCRQRIASYYECPLGFRVTPYQFSEPTDTSLSRKFREFQIADEGTRESWEEELRPMSKIVDEHLLQNRMVDLKWYQYPEIRRLYYEELHSMLQKRDRGFDNRAVILCLDMASLEVNDGVYDEQDIAKFRQQIKLFLNR